jgi:hypothetical protein
MRSASCRKSRDYQKRQARGNNKIVVSVVHNSDSVPKSPKIVASNVDGLPQSCACVKHNVSSEVWSSTELDTPQSNQSGRWAKQPHFQPPSIALDHTTHIESVLRWDLVETATDRGYHSMTHAPPLAGAKCAKSQTDISAPLAPSS